MALAALVAALVLSAGCAQSAKSMTPTPSSSTAVLEATASAPEWLDISRIPPYSSEAATVVSGGEPHFSSVDRVRSSFEEYAELDELGRCGTAFALIGPETMPTGERGQIGDVKPSGWHIAKYDWIDGAYLYNRCHLIGWQLAGENANPRNLITGTRYLNVQGMLPYEDEVAGYVEHTGNHVLYRVTPVFEGDNLITNGVLMEAESVEDEGAGLRFCIWCYNVQPGVSIDYATGQSEPDGTMS